MQHHIEYFGLDTCHVETALWSKCIRNHTLDLPTYAKKQ